MNLSFIKSLRLIGLIEGISYLVLIGIAMPLKYIFEQPLAVRYTGWVHGVLFVLFVAAAFGTWVTNRWSMKWFATAFAASLIPFGTFWLDRGLKSAQEALETPAREKVQA